MTDAIVQEILKRLDAIELRMGINHSRAPSKAIEALDAQTRKSIKVYRCLGDVQRDGYTRTAVSEVLAGRRKTHKGRIWRRADGLSRLLEFAKRFCQREAGEKITAASFYSRFAAFLRDNEREGLTRQDVMARLNAEFGFELAERAEDCTDNGLFWRNAQHQS